MSKKLKTAGIGLDNWKIPVFKRHLSEAGYHFDEPVAFTSTTSVMKVYCDWLAKLQPVINAAERECQERKGELCP